MKLHCACGGKHADMTESLDTWGLMIWREMLVIRRPKTCRHDREPRHTGLNDLEGRCW